MEAQISDPQSINIRLRKLERENRRMKQIGILFAVCASVLIVSGQSKTSKIVEATEFRLVDTAGRVRGSFSTENSITSLMLTDLSEKVKVYLGVGVAGSTLTLGSVDGDTQIKLVSAPSDIAGLYMQGSAGKIEAKVDKDGGGPSLSIEDKDGYSSVLGKSNLILTKTGKKEETPAASLTLFSNEKKVIWSAP
jgi:hypothetical protein